MLTRDQIQFLDRIRIYTSQYEEKDGVINVNTNVCMMYTNLTQIPVQFGKVNGYFDCSLNKLTTLKGSPSIINGYFNCDLNQLTSLENGPKVVGGSYSCQMNSLRNLLGAVNICNGNYYCYDNQLTSLEGCPTVINGNLYCSKNPQLKYLYGICAIKGYVYGYNNNEINKWIIELARKDIIFPHMTLEENINWIKREQKYSSLFDAPEEIWKYFSPYIKNILLDIYVN